MNCVTQPWIAEVLSCKTCGERSAPIRTGIIELAGSDGYIPHFCMTRDLVEAYGRCLRTLIDPTTDWSAYDKVDL